LRLEPQHRQKKSGEEKGTERAAICSAGSVPSVSPAPVHRGKRPEHAAVISRSGVPSGAGMVNFGREYRQNA